MDSAVAPDRPPRPFARGSICYKPYVCDGSAAERIADLLEQAAAAEASGFDGITVSEHHLGFPGYLPNPLQASTWILERTSNVWVAPAPLLLLLRPPNLVVEETAWLAARYPGRVGVGFAAGAIAADFTFAESRFDELAPRFDAALARVAPMLHGEVSDQFGSDPAIALLRARPVPTISAASSHTACRRAARHNVGLLLESAIEPSEAAKLIRTYRHCGGRASTVLVRRVWVGREPPIALEAARDRLVRSVVPVYNREAWMPPESMIIAGSTDSVAEQLNHVLALTGADALNLRVHVPGLDPERVVEQISLLANVLPYIHFLSPGKYT